MGDKSNKKIPDLLIIIIAIPIIMLSIFTIIVAGIMYQKWLDDVTSFKGSDSQISSVLTNDENQANIDDNSNSDISTATTVDALESNIDLDNLVASDGNIGERVALHARYQGMADSGDYGFWIWEYSYDGDCMGFFDVHNFSSETDTDFWDQDEVIIEGTYSGIAENGNPLFTDCEVILKNDNTRSDAPEVDESLIDPNYPYFSKGKDLDEYIEKPDSIGQTVQLKAEIDYADNMKDLLQIEWIKNSDDRINDDNVNYLFDNGYVLHTEDYHNFIGDGLVNDTSFSREAADLDWVVFTGIVTERISPFNDNHKDRILETVSIKKIE